MENLIIPSAIQRIRSFLIEMFGMKVKPWATTEETLAALHTMLVARHGCDTFWASLRGLLATLARDLKMRQEAYPGSLVDNELLDSERYAALLDEIRAALAGQMAEPATFRRLASSLPAPALGLLLLLGGAASVGCSGTGLQGSTQARDAGSADVVDAAQPEARRVISTTIPDTRPATDALAPSQSDGAAVTIQDIMDSCNIPEQQQGQVLGCLAGLQASWTTGIAGLLAGLNCNDVANELGCFVRSENCVGMGPEDFAPEAICMPMPVYVGVRFA